VLTVARAAAGMLRLLEEKEEKLGVTPDADIAELMSGMHHDEDPSCNVALTLQMLQLVNCADTIVGDGMTRGISGGERKRVTTGEIVVGPSKVLFMDEISTGLDSASTFTIVQSLANLAHATDSTIVVSLLQPEPQVLLSTLRGCCARSCCCLLSCSLVCHQLPA
jgi:ABC-type cobalamin/Fe3+-siderophores transport system ATPase subunit